MTLEIDLRNSHDVSQDFYEELLTEYAENFSWEKVLDLQEKHEDIEKKLPNVSDQEFDEYVIIGDMIAALLSRKEQNSV